MDVEDTSEDFMFINRMEYVCPNSFNIIKAKNVDMVKDLNLKAELLGNFLEAKKIYSKDYFQAKSWTSTNLFQFFDQLHSYYFETSQLFTNMSQDEYKKLEIFAGMYRTVHHYSDWNQTRIYTTRIAETFLDELSNKVIDDDIELEYSLFSANEEIMMALISTMRLTSFDCLKDRFMKDYESIYCLDQPDYGSTLVFELSKADSSNKKGDGETSKENNNIPIDDQYYVRVIYNGQPYEFC
jgi:hypothetical protein